MQAVPSARPLNCQASAPCSPSLPFHLSLNPDFLKSAAIEVRRLIRLQFHVIEFSRELASILRAPEIVLLCIPWSRLQQSEIVYISRVHISDQSSSWARSSLGAGLSKRTLASRVSTFSQNTALFHHHQWPVAGPTSGKPLARWS